MKIVYVIRHAKSSWADSKLPDFERPLNERGKSDAPAMAKRLLAKNMKIDAFLTSPAQRAKKTCALFCEEFGIQEEKMIVIESLYLAPPKAFFEVVNDLDNKYNNVAIFAHNPGVTDFVNMLSKDVHIDEMPTCSIFAFEINTEDWKGFKNTEKKFLFFDYPKQSNS